MSARRQPFRTFRSREPREPVQRPLDLAMVRRLWAYTRDLYQHDGVAQTVDLRHIKGHYYESHLRVNPTGIVPLGPVLDFDAPHGRRAPSPDSSNAGAGGE